MNDQPNQPENHLPRTTMTWTKANSASGFVLRYVIPMRQTLTQILGNESEADEALKLFLAHLVSSGFGDHSHGLLRKFLVLGMRSAAKARFEKTRADDSAKLDLDSLKPDSPEWLKAWRSEILRRSWRALERLEHKTPTSPLFSVLRAASVDTKATSEMLSVRLATDANVTVTADQVQSTLPIARETFAQLVADEIAQTLENPTDQDIHREIETLALSSLIENTG